MSRTVCELTVRSLAGRVDVRVERTKYRGHARELAAAAHGELVIVLGGDGSINEVVNGVMSRAGDEAEGAEGSEGSELPLIAVIPGGGGNVFAQALGLPADAAAAIRRVREVIAAQSYRTIGLGLAGDRYFTFSAGLGMDAEVVLEVDRLRAAGRRESASLFLRTMVRHYFRGTEPRALDLFPYPPGASRSASGFQLGPGPAGAAPGPADHHLLPRHADAVDQAPAAASARRAGRARSRIADGPFVAPDRVSGRRRISR